MKILDYQNKKSLDEKVKAPFIICVFLYRFSKNGSQVLGVHGAVCPCV